MKFKVEIKNEYDRKVFENVLLNTIYRVVNRTKNRAVQLCPVDTGRLRSSINLYPAAPGSTEYIIADGVDYGAHVEFGTRPHHPPKGALKGWSKRVLGDEKASTAVEWGIAKHGTPAQPFFRPAMMLAKSRYWREELTKELQKTDTIF